jgi:hypothetical protein
MNRRGGKSKSGGGGQGGNAAILDGPLYDKAYIIALHGNGVVIKPQWADNPKSPLANHIGNDRPINYVSQSGILNGKKMFRCVQVVVHVRFADGLESL